jgi:formate-dependent phosphoribosylglycinamide formyltransferase (GAR transformylase)
MKNVQISFNEELLKTIDRFATVSKKSGLPLHAKPLKPGSGKKKSMLSKTNGSKNSRRLRRKKKTRMLG